VVVEAEQRPGDLMLPRFAQTLGRPVAAVPGRVTSASSRGTHDLLAAGAHLVRDARDVLDVLYSAGGLTVPPAKAAEPRPPIEQHSTILALVSKGADTLDGLRGAGVGYRQAIIALTELELAGRLIRGDGGRYLLSAAPARAASRLSPARRAGL
jgi:DNA processing protein